MAIFSVVYGKGLVYFTNADGNTILDMIPVDMVVNSTIMSMVANANKPCLTIYQVGSSLRNPLTLTKLVATNFQYFIKNPWIDSQGMPVKVKRPKLVKGRLHFLMLMLQRISKLMMLKLVDTTFCHRIKVNQDKLEMQLKVTAKIAMTFRHYLIFHGIFDDKNTEKLRTTMAKANVEKEIFNFDPKCIDWEDYLLNNYIPAIVRYSF